MALRLQLPWLPGALLLLVQIVLLWPAPNVGDWFYFWYVGHLAAIGASPYDPAAWAAISAYGPLGDRVATICADPMGALCLWVYPPWTYIALAPFGASPPETGIRALQAVVLAAAVAAVVIVIRQRPLPQSTLAIAGAIGFAFQPFVISVHSGHADGLFLIGALIAWRGLEGRRRHLSAGVALAALKPHLFVGLFGAAVFRVVRAHQWSLVFVALATSAGLAVIGAIATRAAPLPLGRLMTSAAAKLELGDASTLTLARTVLPTAPWLLYGGIAAASALIALVASRGALRDRRNEVTLAGVLAVSIVASPYVQTYDHLVLFPCLVAALAAKPRSSVGRAVLICGTIIVGLVYPWAAHLHYLSASQVSSALVPCFSLLLLLMAVLLERPAPAA